MSVRRIDRRIYVGSIMAFQRRALLDSEGIRHVIRLDAMHNLTWHGMNVLHLPIANHISPQQFYQATAYIDQHAPVLIQGHTGMNTVMVMAMAYYVEMEKLSLAQAFTRLVMRTQEVFPERRFLKDLVACYGLPYSPKQIDSSRFFQDLLTEAQAQISRVQHGISIGSALLLKDQERVRASGVQAILRLDRLPRMAGQWSDDFALLDMPIADQAAIPADRLRQGIAFVHQQQQAGNHVMIHCQMGVSRAAALTMGYLMAHQGMGLAQALATVRQARPIAQPDAALLQSLIAYFGLPYTPEQIIQPDFLDHLLQEAPGFPGKT